MTDILTWESDEIRELFDQLKKIEEGINLAKENYHPSIASVIGGKYLYPEEELLKAMKKNYRNCRHQK